ncbi:sarcosine oxidase subunit alpha [Bradyrhizobium sp. KBS0727]|uniref:sarcosine oxidase subunit alpha n=1 Tax=unclassified Bradyrhizobium TaxID=2631580 RepID=UPI00110F0847|nr:MULTISPECIES: sarcosine oxidase subunit alpha [unclassified Bradyrhizobium]QDW37240.1 sarcosine oxidase subunit alpha [Bradyrhizobium sp. KBS0725]QDW43842.1 sarcosine oxidase subunit alpha [Bradyrhizobium sp. KBS0727]
MSGHFRIPSGGRVARDQPVRFSFDGRSYQGFAGDTLASALLANGVHLVGRSFKYHRPRGIVTAGSDEPNALVGVGADDAHYTPNLRATQVEIYEGLVAESQNRWPSLGFDVGAVNEMFAPFLTAGFYYKTFMWPPAAWKKIYEPLIRRAAGLGRAPEKQDADRYTQIYAHCDVLIVGAGPAGLAAALAAAATGAKVFVCDEQAEMGGSLLADTSATINGLLAGDWIARALADLAARPNVTLMPRTTAFGWYPHNFLGLCERVTDHVAKADPKLPRERLWQVRAREVVLATGALERPLVFPDNDRPGIMMAEAARIYANRFGVKPGNKAVVFTACDSAYRAALDLKAAGVAIAAIADLRATPSGPWIDRARDAGIDVRTATVVTGTSGRLRVGSVSLGKQDVYGRGGRSETIACDLLLMSGGFTPSVHLFSQSRGKLVYDEALQAYLPGTSVERERSVGACRGVYDLDAVLNDGASGGISAAQAAGFDGAASRSITAEADSVGTNGFIGVTPHGGHPSKTRAWIDFQNDVTEKDVRLAIREGFRSIEHVKRYTTTGMATDQGKTSNMNALGLVSETLKIPVPQVGLTTFRPPYTPTTFGIFAGQSRGDLFDPLRKTPIHDWAVAQGAVFEDVSLWKRAHYFPQPGEDMHAAVARECKATRQAVGIFDATTLGKIEVVGRDAAELMNRIYTNAWTKLEPGRLRYGVMLREDGFVMDDGVVGRMAPDRFHITTTTGGAPRVLAMMEDYIQTEWPDLDVWLTSTTEEWAVIAVQGPLARKVLEPLVEGIEMSREAMPHMSVREGKICGVPTRLFRVSFTGELGFEVNVPAGYGRAVWEAIFAAGQPYGITPYGTETMHVLRAEKGFIIVGQETDGTVTPDDVGLGWAIGKAKKDFVGKRSLARPAMAAIDRKQLVGLLTVDPNTVLEEGAQIVADPNQPIPMTMLGHVTSSYWSATLDRSIALALVRGGRSHIGERLSVPMPDGPVTVELVEPIFYDPKGARLDA